MILYSPPDRHCDPPLKAIFHRNAGVIRPAPGRGSPLLVGVATPVYNHDRSRVNGLFAPDPLPEGGESSKQACCLKCAGVVCPADSLTTAAPCGLAAWIRPWRAVVCRVPVQLTGNLCCVLSPKITNCFIVKLVIPSNRPNSSEV